MNEVRGNRSNDASMRILTYMMPPVSEVLWRLSLKKLVVSRWKMKDVRDGVPAMHRLGRLLTDRSMAVLARAGIVQARREGDALFIRAEADQENETVFVFDSQAGGQSWLDRFGRPGDSEDLGVQLVTLGYRAIEISRTLDREHRFQDLFLWHGLCAEMTEVFADECQRILGNLIRKKHGIRFSFGYPGTPDLGQHGRFVALVGGHEIDVHVTENGMLDPEFSTSAMVLWTGDGGQA